MATFKTLDGNHLVHISLFAALILCCFFFLGGGGVWVFV